MTNIMSKSEVIKQLNNISAFDVPDFYKKYILKYYPYDKEILKMTFQKSRFILSTAPTEVLDKEIIMESLGMYMGTFPYSIKLTDKLKDDRDIVGKLLGKGYSLELFSERLQNDLEMQKLENFFWEKPYVYTNIADEDRNNIEFIKKIITCLDIVTEAPAEFYESLPLHLKNNKEIILLAFQVITQYGGKNSNCSNLIKRIYVASTQMLKNDSDIIIGLYPAIGYRNYLSIIKNLNKDHPVFNDKKAILQILQFAHQFRDITNFFSNVTYDWRNDHDINLLLAKMPGTSFSMIEAKWLGDKNFALEVMKTRREIFFELPEGIRNDIEIKEEMLHQFSKEELTVAQKYIQDFIIYFKENNSINDKLKYCIKQNITEKDLEHYLILVQSTNPTLFASYEQVKYANEDATRTQLLTQTSKVLNGLKNGVMIDDNQIRSFTIVDYYLITTMNYEQFFKALKTIKASAKDYQLFRTFINQNKLDMTMNVNVEMKCKRSFLVDGQPKEVTNDDKQYVLNFMKEHQIPLYSKIYSILLKDYTKQTGIYFQIEQDEKKYQKLK